MDDIVSEAGLSKGAIYWYFNSKDEIIIAILDRLFERELASLRELQEDSRSAPERVSVFAETALHDMVRLLQLMPLAYEFYSMAFRIRAVRQALTNYFRSYMEALVPLLAQGVQRGEFRQIDPMEAAIAIGAIMEGTILLWVYDRETVDLERHIRTSLQLLLNGMLP